MRSSSAVRRGVTAASGVKGTGADSMASQPAASWRSGRSSRASMSSNWAALSNSTSQTARPSPSAGASKPPWLHSKTATMRAVSRGTPKVNRVRSEPRRRGLTLTLTLSRISAEESVLMGRH
jgi:hypothetical protein